MDTDEDGVLTFDEFILPYQIDFEDQSQATQKRLEIERRAFDNRDSNLNGALEGEIWFPRISATKFPKFVLFKN